MTGPPRHPDSRRHSTLRWATILGIIAVIVALLLVVMLLIGGGGGHGPGRHAYGGDTPTSTVTDDRTASGAGVGGHTQRPEGGHEG
jgi:hypothetical protein